MPNDFVIVYGSICSLQLLNTLYTDLLIEFFSENLSEFYQVLELLELFFQRKKRRC